MQAAEARASFVFRYDPDRETKIADAISTAWEFAQRCPPDVRPAQLGKLAVARVRVGRQFRQSVRSLGGPPLDWRRKTRKPERMEENLDNLASVGDDPALVVEVRHDFRVVFARLSKFQQAVVLRLAVGDRTSEAAETCGVCQGRISQIRALFKALWDAR